MQPLTESLVTLVRAVAAIGLSIVFSIASAGSIGFSVAFTGDEVSISNAGTEAGYRISLWTLDQSSRWRKLQIHSGNADYLAPGQTLKGRRVALVPSTGLGRGDPLLLEVYDQAGGRVTQLAWRVAPAMSKSPMPTQRKDARVFITTGIAGTVASYGIVVPYEGIAQLARGFAPGSAPPDPQRHSWASAGPMVLETGAGKGGAWLVHETSAGVIEVQIVADGFDRGKEQIPSWLIWVRSKLMTWAAVLAGFGALLLVLGAVWRGRQFERVLGKVA